MTNEKIVILQNGGGWGENIGCAFVDLGSIESLRQATSNINAEVHLTGVFSRFMFCAINRSIKECLLRRLGDTTNVFNVQKHNKVDYVVVWGAFISKSWFEVFGETLFNLKYEGTRIIINGGGMSENAYSQREIKESREILRRLSPYVFISRDEESFNNFKDLAKYSYNGIDSAFFVSDCYKPLKLDMPEYIILNFDYQPEPDIKSLNIDTNKYLIIRTHHCFWRSFWLSQYFGSRFTPNYYLKRKSSFYNKENTMISDLPYDYLDLYANSSGVYSDRVHACVATLSYGKPARLFSKTPRALLFDRIGASKVKEELVTLDMSKINLEKQKQIEFLSEIFRAKDGD